MNKKMVIYDCKHDEGFHPCYSYSPNKKNTGPFWFCNKCSVRLNDKEKIEIEVKISDSKIKENKKIQEISLQIEEQLNQTRDELEQCNKTLNIKDITIQELEESVKNLVQENEKMQQEILTGLQNNEAQMKLQEQILEMKENNEKVNNELKGINKRLEDELVCVKELFIKKNEENTILAKELENTRNEIGKIKISGLIEYGLINYEDFKFVLYNGIPFKLGNGAYGSVYLANYNEIKVAVKQIEIDNLKGITKNKILNEIYHNACIRHPNICLFYGYCENQVLISEFNIKKEYIYLLSEFYTNGTLMKVISENKKIELNQKISWLSQIALGLKYLHTRNPPIIHRDLKPANIFSTDNMKRAVIGDFGLSKSFYPKFSEKLSSFTGTINWMAPEILEGLPYGLEADIYSFGIIMYEVIFESVPYDLQVKGYTPEGSLTPEVPVNNNVPLKLINLMKKCWLKESKLRPKIDEIIETLK